MVKVFGHRQTDKQTDKQTNRQTDKLFWECHFSDIGSVLRGLGRKKNFFEQCLQKRTEQMQDAGGSLKIRRHKNSLQV